jgi:hypothetical protein
VNDFASSETTTVGDACKTLLDKQIEVERTKKGSLEARGLAVITTSGTLVTLLLGLSGVITTVHAFAPPLAARLLLIAAVVAFIFAAALGIYCNAPLRYRELDPESLRTMTAFGVWTAPGHEAEREIAIARLDSLIRASDVNEDKATALLIATTIEVIAMVFTGLAAAVILSRG